MAALDDLLARIENTALRADLELELAPLRGVRELGLVFERHLPETVRLPGLVIRRGSTVEMSTVQGSPAWQVCKITKGIAQLKRRDSDGGTITDEHPINQLVVIREFGESIYPGLKSVGRVELGGNKPFHTVINAENYHALETLLYTCEGRVDAIYIDPPYNTGARDWKYNNDYVDANDGYRHSKWLSFMEKRLILAKRLLNPEDSTLIITIDEKEVHHLGALLEQLFPGTVRQLVTIVINPLGQARKRELARVEEFAFFVFLGVAGPTPVSDDFLSEEKTAKSRSKVRWEWLIRGGTHSLRRERPNLFFPIYVDPAEKRIVSVGDSISLDSDRRDVEVHPGLIVVWPLNTNGNEGNWRCSAEYLRGLIELGYAKLGAYDAKNDRFSILYLGKAQIKRIATGEIRVIGRDPDGFVILEGDQAQVRLMIPKTVWSRLSVHDCLNVAVGKKSDALILDFFAGSGTTAHATALLNKEDGGRRRSISITNNEVSEDEAKSLSRVGYAPGQPEWERLGIFEHIAMPRITAAFTGKTPEGDDVEGNYLSPDEFPMVDGFEENVEFFELTYEDPDHVRLGSAFQAVSALLWLMAGAEGPRVDRIEGAWALPEGGRYGILFDPDAWNDFVSAVRAALDLSFAFVVTDSDAVFQRVVAELPDSVNPVRLYESYLRTFAINTGAES